jgi:DNA-directed RNA polymerase subunit RPC12/RpoP
MFEKKHYKICPFCRSKIIKVQDKYHCHHCGSEIDPKSIDTRAHNMNFFNNLR